MNIQQFKSSGIETLATEEKCMQSVLIQQHSFNMSSNEEQEI
jgi:hypothetical protein